MPERLNGSVSKTEVWLSLHRGFESHSLRQPPNPHRPERCGFVLTPLAPATDRSAKLSSRR